MRRGTVFVAAAALALMVGTANAEGISGAIEEIDPEANTIVVGGTVFIVASGHGRLEKWTNSSTATLLRSFSPRRAGPKTPSTH